MRCVEVLPAIRSSRFDLPLTYDAGALDLRVGDVVRIPLGAREQLGFVVSDPREADSDRPLRAIAGLAGVPRAFTAGGLQLARFVSAYYLCTLGEALGPVVLSGAIPRVVDTFVRAAEPPRAKHPSVPARLITLLWSELADGFTLDQVLRHPESRRAGDRSLLLGSINVLVRSGSLRRERRFAGPRTQEYRVKVLFPGDASIRGAKAAALVDFVAEQPGVPRADALLAGFSSAVVARAVKTGALREADILPARERAEGKLTAAAFPPTDEQRLAIEVLVAALEAHAFHETLLHGITGSGKTYVYIEAVKHVVRSGARAIVLVPEISLTPQTARRFERAFGQRVSVLHSALSERERFEAWQACADGAVDVVVGARSAVFAPLQNVRLIVVDEAHESTYKQETVPRYHAVRVARERMRLERGVLVQGSATPSLESYAQALEGRIELLSLRSRATRAALPAIRVVDMAKEFEGGNRRIFSTVLTQALGDRLRRGEKTVLFVNRRGSAGFLLCRGCGNVPKCSRCSVSLTLHRGEGLLRCHYCDAQRPVPASCEECSSDSIREFGVGTERVADDVKRLYPDATVIRMDSDTTTRLGDHARLLDAFGTNGDILVGTQMVAKGLDFPTVTLVGVIAADIGLHAPEFRASERAFDLIMQVCGRSGRERAGEAIVQTYSPENAAIGFASRNDYDGFARAELHERAALRYPPQHELLYLGVIARSRSAAFARAGEYAAILGSMKLGEVLGPAAYPVARLNNEWRFRIALKGSDAEAMRAALKERIIPLARADRTTRLAISVDP